MMTQSDLRPGASATTPQCPIFLVREDFVAEQLDFGWVYDITPLATFRMVTRLEHVTEEARHLDHQQHSVLELREREGLFRYVAQRQFDVDSGGRGSRFFGSKATVLKQTQIWQPSNWDGSRRYDVTGELSGMAVDIVGDGALTPIGAGGTRYSISLTVRSTGRLAGRKAETAIAESLTRSIEAAHTFRTIWLDRKEHTGF
jgi:uncharacterized protein DUF2505